MRFGIDYITHIFRSPPTLDTDRLIIRKILPRDAEDMYEYTSREDVTEYLTWYPHPNLKYTRQYIRDIGRCYLNGSFFDWGIIWKENNKFIGTCGFTSIDTANNSAEAGYVINPDYKSRGIATEALHRVLEFAFYDLEFERVEAKHIVGNDASAAVMKKCGMSFEGIKRHGMIIKNEYRDIAIYSILKKEFDKSEASVG